jgi:peptidoglycan/LPS O-acetylase OafA/YrhL
MGIYYPAVVTWAIRCKRWLWLAVYVAGGAYVGMLLLQQYGLAMIENTWFELALLAYCLTIPLVCVPWARNQLARGSRISAFLSALGAASFGIYLVHPAILTLWDRVSPEPAPGRLWLYDVHTAAAVLIGLLGALLLTRGYARAVQKGSARR